MECESGVWRVECGVWGVWRVDGGVWMTFETNPAKHCGTF